MFEIEKMKAKGMDPCQIEICRQINENSAKRDSCPGHEQEASWKCLKSMMGSRSIRRC